MKKHLKQGHADVQKGNEDKELFEIEKAEEIAMDNDYYYEPLEGSYNNYGIGGCEGWNLEQKI